MACEGDQKPAVAAELTVNGQKIELTGFVQDFIGRAVIGMVTSLKGVADVQKVKLNISRPAEQ
ncbi:MAG: hypothetical protein ACYSTT_06875 [Planctomycetota bacterium]|jgi:hypothetical protein